MALAMSVIALQHRGFVRLHHAVAVRKGQAHHRVLQALAGVDGDDLDQVFIALEPHGLFFAVARTA